MPNQKCNHLKFKSFNIPVFCLLFYAKVVHFVRLPASRIEQYKDPFSLVWFYPHLSCHHLFLVSVISICCSCIGNKPLVERDFEVRSQAETQWFESLGKCITFIIERIYLGLKAIACSQWKMECMATTFHCP